VTGAVVVGAVVAAAGIGAGGSVVVAVLVVVLADVVLVALGVTFVTLPFFQASRSFESVSNADTDSPEARAIMIACALG
jgi:hypothetical protein